MTSKSAEYFKWLLEYQRKWNKAYVNKVTVGEKVQEASEMQNKTLKMFNFKQYNKWMYLWYIT
jgi:hypothetical protein